tara:strand:+ start:2447 stop:4117 length:1671 start_codon:yes stop_codon:yes gene_type:complete
MAIYRPEQARLSFHGEAGHGGYLDVITSITDPTDWTGVLSAAAAAGSRSVTFDGASGTLAVGNYVMVGVDPFSEVRKVASLGSYNGTGATGTIFLDYPLGFHHADDDIIDEKTATSVVGNSFATFLPGVYESVTVPDMTPEFQPHWFLSTSSNRNFSRIYRGNQTFNGSLPNFILLNGYALRFPFGTVATTGTSDGTGASTLSSAMVAGEIIANLASATGYSAGEFIQIDTGTANSEVRQIIAINTNALTLNYPVMIAHDSGVSCEEVIGPYTHTIAESAELQSTTWNLMMRDTGETAANDFIRRYVGGMVNRATLSADEGGLLMYSWDDVQFLDLVHNQALHSSITGEIAKSSVALIDPTQGASGDAEGGIGGAIPEDSGALGDADFETNEPYYYSQGAISLFGVEFARIRNFRLEVNNNIEARRYLSDNGSDRIPNDLQENRREYRMNATIAMEDSIIAATATTRSLWKELIVEGNYDGGLEGFNVTLTFTRGTNDTIVITMPSATADDDLEEQGVFISRAPHNIGTEAPVQVDVEMLVRNMSIVVTDSEAVYP